MRPRADALRFRGRLQFASGQLFGRLAKKALSIVTGHAYLSKNATLDAGTISALKLYLSCLEVVSFMQMHLEKLRISFQLPWMMSW